MVPHTWIPKEMPDQEVSLFFDGSFKRLSQEGSIGFVIMIWEARRYVPNTFKMSGFIAVMMLNIAAFMWVYRVCGDGLQKGGS